MASSAVWQAADKNPATANCHAEAAQAVHNVRLAEGEAITGPDPGLIGYRPPAGGELAAQAVLLREVVGNPFVAVPAACTAQTPTQALHQAPTQSGRGC